jgi:hypothetical protein
MRMPVLLFSAALLAQQPQIQNGPVQTRTATSLERDVAAIAAAATDPVWIGWREKAADGLGSACCWYSSDSEPMQRGCAVEPRVPNTRGWAGMDQPDPRPQFPAPSGPVRLEAGTEVLIMLRIVDKQVERVRTFSDDCPLDAGGRQVVWLDGVPAADSVRYLRSLIALDADNQPADLRRRLNSAAVTAIGMHHDANIDALIALAEQSQDKSVRSNAFTWIGKSRDPKALKFIDAILK